MWQEDEGRKIVAASVKLAEEAVETDRKLVVKHKVVFAAPVPQ